eukprot:UN19748
MFIQFERFKIKPNRSHEALLENFYISNLPTSFKTSDFQQFRESEKLKSDLAHPP